MQKKNYVKRKIEKIVAGIARKTASVEANTACACLTYQSKEPQNLKKLRKF